MTEKLAHILKKAVLALLYIGIYSFIQQALFVIVQLSESDTMNYSGVVTIFAAVAALAIFGVIHYLRGKKLSKRIRIRRPVLLDIVLSFTLALGFRLLTTVYFVWAEKIEVLDKSIESAQSLSYNFNTMTNLGAVSILFSIIIIAPIIEEILFRGIVQKELSEGIGVFFAIIVQGILFGYAHGFLVQSIFTAVFGIILGILHYKTNNLTITILVHMFFNFSSILTVENSTLWPQMVVTGIALTLASLFIFVYVYRKTHTPNDGVIAGGNNNG